MVEFSIFMLVVAWLAWSAGPPYPASGKSRRWWAVLLLSLLQFGCTSMQRVDTTPEDLQAQIRAGKYLQAGHDVTIFTAEGKEVWFRFERIENDAIVGHTQLGDEGSVPIADVAGLKTDRFSVGRTAALIGGGIVTWVVAFIALVVATY